jgi:hypothetical protein
MMLGSWTEASAIFLQDQEEIWRNEMKNDSMSTEPPASTTSSTVARVQAEERQ